MPATVVAVPLSPAAPLALVDLVDFKWLMHGEGHGVDLARLQTDRAYARGCLAVAGGSTIAALRQAARRLGAKLLADPPAGMDAPH
jgi:hypothetical protein